MAIGRRVRGAAAGGRLLLVAPVLSLVSLYSVMWLVVMLVGAVVVGGLEPVVLTSGSMAPGAARGDVVLIDPPGTADILPGTVVTFRDPTGGERLVTHRIDAVLPDGRYRTKGDANPAPDTTPLHPSHIVGVGRLLVPFVALPVVWVASGQHHLLAALAALVVLALVGARLPVAQPAPDHRPVALSPRRGRRMRRLGQLVVLTVLATQLGPAERASAQLSGSTTSDGSWTAATLAAPTGVAASASCQLLILGPKVTVTWNAASVAGGYEVLRSETSGKDYVTVGTVGAEATSYTDTTVSGAKTYYYVVRTTAGGWRSQPSAEVSVSTPVCV